MKIKSIAGLMKARKQIVLLNDEHGCQWISDGRACYPLYGMPELDKENILTVMDIPEKDREKYTVRHENTPIKFNFGDSDDTERELLPQLLTIGYGGSVYIPARTSLGLQFIDPDYLKPLSDKPFELYERESINGEIYIAIKSGFVLQAVIIPAEVNREDIAERLLALYSELRQSITRPVKVDEDTGEVVEGLDGNT